MQNIPVKKTILTVLALAAMSLSGCGYLTIGEENFSCSGMPGDPKCMSTSDMYNYSINGRAGTEGRVLSGSGVPTNVTSGEGEVTVYAPYTDMEETDKGVKTEGQVIVGDDIIVQNFVTPKLPYMPVPVRTPSQVMRIWIASYTDLNGDLIAPGYVYTEIEGRKWVLNNDQASQSSSDFQPLVKRPKGYGGNANASIGNLKGGRSGGSGSYRPDHGHENSLEILAEKQRAKQRAGK